MNGVKGSLALERTLSQDDFDCFAALSGDDNPIHVDPEFCRRTRFGRTVSHGLLLSTILRGLLEDLLPGARHVSQQLMFPAPTFAGDPMRFAVAIESEQDDTVIARLSCTRIADGIVTCQGQSTLTRADN